jgi:hypothetical protein
MTIQCKTILLNASRTLQDELAFTRWPLLELFDYLKDGLRALGGMRTAALRSTQVVTLAAGPLQSLTNVYELISVTRNITAQVPAKVYGRSVRRINLDALNATNRDWTGITPTKRVDNLAFDPIEKHRFWVYPPNDGTGVLEVQVAVAPDSILPTGSGLVLADYNMTLPVDEEYAPALTHYVLHRAWAKDADFAGNMDRSNNEYKLFLESIKMNAEEKLGGPA